MALKLKHIKINDRDTVRALIVESWDTIYPNISLIDNSLTRREEVVCDLVGVSKDSNKLVFGFIEITDDNASLIRLINTFDWIKENLYLLNKAYSKPFLDINSSPDFLVIAPDFSNDFLNSLTYLDIPNICLYQFYCMEVDGKKGIILEEMMLPDKKVKTENKEKQKESFNVCLECLGLTREEEEDLLSPLD